MSFFKSADFVEAFRNGGCFIFEGEDDPPEVPDVEPSEEPAEETPEEPAEAPAEATEQTEEQQPDEQPEKTSTPDDLKQNTAETINSDSQKKVNKPTLNADQIAQKFKESGAMKQVLAYAGQKLQGQKDLKEKDILPYIKAGIEKFCQQQSFNTNPEEIANAIKSVTNSLGMKHAKAEQAKAAEAEKAKKAQEAKAAQSQGGEAPSGGEEAQSGGGEEAPEAPDAGGKEAPQE